MEPLVTKKPSGLARILVATIAIAIGLAACVSDSNTNLRGPSTVVGLLLVAIAFSQLLFIATSFTKLQMTGRYVVCVLLAAILTTIWFFVVDVVLIPLSPGRFSTEEYPPVKYGTLFAVSLPVYFVIHTAAEVVVHLIALYRR